MKGYATYFLFPLFLILARILSLVADATKARRVCKPSESQAPMALVICRRPVGALAFPLTDKTRTTTISSWRHCVFNRGRDGLSDRPPHRSVRTELPHTVLTLDN